MNRQKGGRQTQKIKSFKLSLKIAEHALQPFHMQTLQIEGNQLEMNHTWIIIAKLDLLALASKINWIVTTLVAASTFESKVSSVVDEQRSTLYVI